MSKEGQLTICDIGVHWEGPNSLDAAFANKISTYSTPPFLKEIDKIYKPTSVKVTAFIIGARGVWCPLNKEIIDLLEITSRQANTITADTIKGSFSIHAVFGSRVWTAGGKDRTHKTP